MRNCFPWMIRCRGFLLAALLSCATSARAEPEIPEPEPPPEYRDPCGADPDCQALVDNAKELHNANLFEAALIDFQKAYHKSNAPWLLFNIGRVQQRLGQYENAIQSYRHYLDSRDEQPEHLDTREKVERALKQTEKAQDEQKKRMFQSLTSANAPKTPIHKRWWFWTLLSGTAVGISLGVGFVIATRDPEASNLVTYRLFTM